MQAPQLRLNEREANPNPFVIFIRSLQNKKDHTDALDILRAVAAQMKSIMRDRFMQVHTLEEAAFNRVFAGRNWNYGQSIELVLRGPSGRFLPMPYIIAVMCHEMAHIEQMNHGPKFQALMNDIKSDVSRLQARGHYGDGFWSDGKRLKDSVRMGGEGLRASDFPEYVCGVSAADAKKAKRPTRGPRASKAPGLVKGEASNQSGRQTEYKRKAGRRNNVDMGDVGARLDGIRAITNQDRDARKAFIDDRVQTLTHGGLSMTRAKKRAGEDWEQENPWWAESNTRSKVAKSKTAAALRAEAVEARLRTLALPPQDIKPMKDEPLSGVESGSDDELEEIPDPGLSIEDRKKQMDEMDEEEKDDLRGGWEEFIVPSGIPSPGTFEDKSSKKRPSSPSSIPGPSSTKQIRTVEESTTVFSTDLIRKERLRALGLAPARGRTLGATSTSSSRSREVKDEAQDVDLVEGGKEGWTCKICTYINLIDHGRCEMCQARPDGSKPEDVNVIF